MPTRPAPLIFAACLAFVFGATCVTHAAPPDPCSLLTQAEVSAALTVNVAPGKASAGKICRWAPTGARAGGPALVLTMQDAKTFDFAKKPSTSANLVKTPAGVGDDAVFNTMGVVTATLTVRKGDAYFEVHVYGFPLDQTKNMEMTVAKEVVAKLK